MWHRIYLRYMSFRWVCFLWGYLSHHHITVLIEISNCNARKTPVQQVNWLKMVVALSETTSHLKQICDIKLRGLSRAKKSWLIKLKSNCMEDQTQVPNSWPQNIFAAFGSILMQMKLAHGPLHAGYTNSHIWGYTPVNVCWILHAQLLKGTNRGFLRQPAQLL